MRFFRALNGATSRRKVSEGHGIETHELLPIHPGTVLAFDEDTKVDLEFFQELFLFTGLGGGSTVENVKATTFTGQTL